MVRQKLQAVLADKLGSFFQEVLHEAEADFTRILVRDRLYVHQHLVDVQMWVVCLDNTLEALAVRLVFVLSGLLDQVLEFLTRLDLPAHQRSFTLRLSIRILL